MFVTCPRGSVDKKVFQILICKKWFGLEIAGWSLLIYILHWRLQFHLNIRWVLTSFHLRMAELEPNFGSRERIVLFLVDGRKAVKQFQNKNSFDIFSEIICKLLTLIKEANSIRDEEGKSINLTASNLHL